MFNKIKRFFVVGWIVVSSVVIVVLVMINAKMKNKATIKNIEEKAENAKEATKIEIEQTSAGELVNNADNANELHAGVESIKIHFRDEVMCRIREKLHEQGSSRTP